MRGQSAGGTKVERLTPEPVLMDGAGPAAAVLVTRHSFLLSFFFSSLAAFLCVHTTGVGAFAAIERFRWRTVALSLKIRTVFV